MKKVFRRIAAVCMAAIMMATVLCAYAFAYGELTQTYGMANNVPYYECVFSGVDGSDHSYTHGKYGGAMEKNSFYVTEDGYYTITFGNSGEFATNVYFWKSGTFSSTGTAYHSLSIPSYSPGIPGTLSTSYYFTKGYYDVEVICAKHGEKTNGSFRVYGVLKNAQGS